MTLLTSLEGELRRFATRHGAMWLRLTLGALFLWSGVLKLIDRSPVAGFVEGGYTWLPGDLAMPLLGAVQVAVGLGLLLRLASRLTMLLLWLHLLGWLLVLVFQRDLAFQAYNPLLLTTLGDFAIRALVLTVAGIVVAGGARD